MAVRIVGGSGDAPVTTFNGLDLVITDNNGYFVANGGLTAVTGTARVDTRYASAVDISGTELAAVFTNITAEDRVVGVGNNVVPEISINNASGTFGVTGEAILFRPISVGVSITNSPQLTSTFQKVTITQPLVSDVSGMTLTDGGTVNILGGRIEANSLGHGIRSTDTNLSVNMVSVLGGADAIQIVNTGTPHTVSVTNSSISGTININSLNVSGAANSGLSISNSHGLASVIQSVTTDTVGLGWVTTVWR